MSTPFSTNYTPPAPVFHIRLAAPGEVANTDQLTAIIDTGSDSTLVPTHYLEQVEAIGVGDAIVLNKLILLLDGQQANTSILERRSQVSNL